MVVSHQMAVGYLRAPSTAADRVRRTVALLRRRGFAVSPSRLAALCLGGPLSEADVRWAVAASPDLAQRLLAILDPLVDLLEASHRRSIADHVGDVLTDQRCVICQKITPMEVLSR